MYVHLRDAGTRALVLCGDAELRRKLAALLGEAGIAVDAPDTGGRAARLLKQSPYHVFVTDRVAARWPGLGDLPGLKRRYDRMRILVVSPQATRGDRTAHAIVGADVVVQPPLTETRVLAAVLAICARNDTQAIDANASCSPVESLEVRVNAPPRACPIRSILVATDLTDRSDQALQRAAELARQLGANIDVLHALEPGLPCRISDRRAREAHAVIVQRMKLLMPASSAIGEICIRVGDPSWEISRVASQRESDIVVLGPHGKGRLEHHVLETTGVRVLRHCTQPILYANGPVSRRWHRVVVGLEPTASEPMATVIALRIAPGAETVFVCANSLNDWLHRHDFEPVATAKIVRRLVLPLPRPHGGQVSIGQKGAASTRPVDRTEDVLDALWAACQRRSNFPSAGRSNSASLLNV